MIKKLNFFSGVSNGAITKDFGGCGSNHCSASQHSQTISKMQNRGCLTTSH